MTWIDDLLAKIADNASEIVADLSPAELTSLIQAINHLENVEATAETKAQLEAPINEVFGVLYAVPDLHWLLPDADEAYRSIDPRVMFQEGTIRYTDQRIPQLRNKLVRCRQRLAEELNAKQQSEIRTPGNKQ
jgi:hypothetical protein